MTTPKLTILNDIKTGVYGNIWGTFSNVYTIYPTPDVSLSPKQKFVFSHRYVTHSFLSETLYRLYSHFNLDILLLPLQS